MKLLISPLLKLYCVVVFLYFINGSEVDRSMVHVKLWMEISPRNSPNCRILALEPMFAVYQNTAVEY